MGVGKVSDATFEAEVLKSSSPVVVDFWAEWCGPCRMIAPALEEIAGSMGEKVKIVKVNVDENTGIATKYGIEVFKSDATKIGVVTVPEQPTGMAFAGADLKTLYVTTGGTKIWELHVNVPGIVQ